MPKCKAPSPQPPRKYCQLEAGHGDWHASGQYIWAKSASVAGKPKPKKTKKEEPDNA